MMMTEKQKKHVNLSDFIIKKNKNIQPQVHGSTKREGPSTG
jgi:hypothetical protein